MFKFVEKFRDYELLLFEKVKSRLSDEANEILNKQLDAVNHIQRLYDDKEVDLYRKKWGKPTFDESIKFPIDFEEIKLCEIKIKSSVGRMKVDFWIVEGFLFQLKFSVAPQKYFEDEYEITEINLFIDPFNNEINTLDNYSKLIEFLIP